MIPLITTISPVHSRTPANIVRDGVTPILEPLLDEKGHPICWLDQLCGGGIRLPCDLGPEPPPDRGGGEGRPARMLDDLGWGPYDRAGRPPGDQPNPRGRSVLLLLSGPAGTGKSTFALELCCRLVRNARGPNRTPFNALYVSTEEGAGRLIAKAQSLGWSSAAEGDSRVVVMGRDQLDRDEDPNRLFVEMANRWQRYAEQLSPQSPDNPRPLDLLVLDSLNVISPLKDEQQRIRTFDAIQAHLADPAKQMNPGLILVALDAADEDEASRYWEFISDIVFRFGWETKLDYSMRTFEIVKMRGQQHALGKQRLKIYDRQPGVGEGRSYESPYLQAGGIFVFPSIHWHLSTLRERRAADVAASAPGPALGLPEAVGGLNTQVAADPEYQGLPPVGCTALVGPRGAMKSHLAYLFLLDQAAGGPGRGAARNCLLVSLRDDLAGAIDTLRQIAEDNLYSPPGGGAAFVRDLIEKDRLEILENEIGMISPEEFFHKIYVAVRRRRQQPGTGQRQGHGRVQVVVVNGLDQLEARFPLIALEEMFVPALIQLLKANGVCSVIISSVGESATPAGRSLYGLLPMAELILRFDPLDPNNPPPGYAWPGSFPQALVAGVAAGNEQIMRVETQRVPGGQIGGRVGYLYRTAGGALVYAR